MLRNALFSACAFLLTLMLCVAVPAQAQSSSSSTNKTNATSTNSKANHSQNNNSQEKMDLSKKTVHALRLTAEARQAIIDKNQDRAKTDVNQAVDLLNQVAQKNTGGADLVPIYAELEQTSFIAPVLAAKNNVQNQQQSAASTSTSTNNSSNSQMAQNKASSALPQSDQPNSAKQPDVVNWVEGGYSYIALDVNQARQHLQAAQQALNSNNAGQADIELARAQEAVDTGSFETNMPLVRARENLTLARADMASGNTKNAKSELTAAANALNSYASTNVHAPHATDAKNLAQQIKSSSTSLSNNTTASQKIDSWWNKLADWTGQKTS